MSDIGRIGQAAAPPPASAETSQQRNPSEPAVARGDDQVEVSGAARLRAKLAELPEVRQELIDRVRTQIDADVYVTDEKVDAAVDGLIQDIEDGLA